MRKRFISLSVSILLLAMAALPASAAAVDLKDPETVLPVDIVIDQDAREIRKVYDLSPNTDPSTFPMEAFDRDGLHYECSDILREVIIGSETQTVTQTETVDSDKKDMEVILELLPQEKEVTTEDGLLERCGWTWTASRPSPLAMVARPSRSQPPEHIRISLTQIRSICPRPLPMAGGH